MAWYLRKHVSVGPIRFNLSKGGVGVSAGITGFRVGIRPNGSSYVHAGRHGLYLRQELGSVNNSNGAQAWQRDEFTATDVNELHTITTRDLASEERKALVDKLGKSYTGIRFDYVVFAAALIALLIALSNGNGTVTTAVGIAGLAAGMLAVIIESRRRTVRITYDFEGDDTSSYTKLVDAANHLAQCGRLWATTASKDVFCRHEAKKNAGASRLVTRQPALMGTGTPPWVETNVSIPMLKAKDISLYFMPDCVLVYDEHGVASIEHSDLILHPGTVRFIEDESVPADAEVVDHTWLHPNKNGGPDRRFSNNRQIPVCVYGTLEMHTSAGPICHLQTSSKDAPRMFARTYPARHA